MTRLTADLSLVLVTLIWGSTFVIVRQAMAEVGPFTFLTWRFVLATLPLAVLFRGRLTRLKGGELRWGALVGLFLFLGFIFQTTGLRYTTASKAGFITGLSVVTVPLLLAGWRRRLPSRPVIVGVVLATAGLAFLSLQEGLSLAWGDLLVLVCAVSFALHILAVGYYARRMDAIALTVVQVAVVALLAWLGALLFESWRLPQTAGLWAAAGFTGLVATVLAYLIQNLAQRRASATHTAIIFTLEPVFAALFAWWLAGEPLTGRSLAGGGLIVLGMLATELQGVLRRRQPFPVGGGAAPPGLPEQPALPLGD